MNQQVGQPNYWSVVSSTGLKLFLFIICSLSAMAQSGYAQKNGNDSSFKSDVIGIKETMLNPTYWEQKISAGTREILTPEQISLQNQQLLTTDKNMQQVLSYPAILSADRIRRQITSISKIPTSRRYSEHGVLLTDKDYHRYIESLNLDALQKDQKIRFGLVVRRADMRTFPTEDKVFKTTKSINLDRFQETALFPTQAVAILHESKDRKWFFAVSYNYSAWVKKDAIAIGKRQQILNYKQNRDFLVITGDKVFTSYNPYNKNISQLQLEMGTKVPLVPANEVPKSIGGQNTYTSYVISLPTRNEKGELKLAKALIPRKADVHQGYLPFTEQNLLSQSFKFLGERYGWGHSFNARDCTGFVGEVYKSFGILMPRNTGQQAKSKLGKNIHFTKAATRKEKLQALSSLEVGDLIYIPGHVMMVIGYDAGKPYIIHDVSGLSYFNKQGKYYQSVLNGVSVTPFLPLQLSKEKTYLDRVNTIKKIK